MIKLNEILEVYSDEEFIKVDGFDNAVIGVEANSMRLVYSVDGCLEILMAREQMSEIDAIEYLYYTVMDSYEGTANAPIWINTIL